MKNDDLEFEKEKIWMDLKRREKLYYELLNNVETKNEGESRHETGLRYIREAERGGDEKIQNTDDYNFYAWNNFLAKRTLYPELSDRIDFKSFCEITNQKYKHTDVH